MYIEMRAERSVWECTCTETQLTLDYMLIISALHVHVHY